MVHGKSLVDPIKYQKFTGKHSHGVEETHGWNSERYEKGDTPMYRTFRQGIK
jgi:hypothetical protein